jgi:hypothetical protein
LLGSRRGVASDDFEGGGGSCFDLMYRPSFFIDCNVASRVTGLFGEDAAKLPVEMLSRGVMELEDEMIPL